MTGIVASWIGSIIDAQSGVGVAVPGARSSGDSKALPYDCPVARTG
jgi:hypothetical protein